jgi:hypothetical protein
VKTDEAEPIDSLDTLLDTLGGGDARAELNDEIRRLVSEVTDLARETGKAKGALTLKVKLSGDKKGAVTVDYDLSLKRPVKPRASGVLFTTKNGSLVTSDPRQARLPGVDPGGEHRAARDPSDSNVTALPKRVGGN